MKEKIHAILIPAICLLGTSACSVVHKAYKAPRVEHAEQLYGPYGTADSVTAAFVPWRAYFTDTLLVRLIDEASWVIPTCGSPRPVSGWRKPD